MSQACKPAFSAAVRVPRVVGAGRTDCCRCYPGRIGPSRILFGGIGLCPTCMTPGALSLLTFHPTRICPVVRSMSKDRSLMVRSWEAGYLHESMVDTLLGGGRTPVSDGSVLANFWSGWS
jgi:hypothetical protein